MREMTIDEKIDLLDRIISELEVNEPYGDFGLCNIITVYNSFIMNTKLLLEESELISIELCKSFPEFYECAPRHNKYIRDEYFYGFTPRYWFTTNERTLFVLLLRELLISIKETEANDVP